MGVDHVEVALGDWNIDRLAQRSARMMQARQHVDELREVAEILDRGIAPAFIEIADEGGAINRREHGVVAAYGDGVGRVARMLRVFAGRGLDQ